VLAWATRVHNRNSIDLSWFSHFCTAHGRMSSYMPRHVLYPKNCTFALGDLDPQLTDGSLDQPECLFQMESQLVLSYFAQLTEECPYTLQWAAPFPPQKCPFPWEICTPIQYIIFWVHPRPQCKRYLDRFSHLCRAHDSDRPTNRQTDHATRSVRIGRIYVCSTVMQHLYILSTVRCLYVCP